MNSTRLSTSAFNFWILRITAFFWIIFKVLSLPLWVSETRTFPLVPFIQQISAINLLVFDVILGLNLFFLLLICLRPNVWWITGVLMTEVTLILADQLRLQPAIYQYILTFFFFILKPGNFKYYFLFLLSAIYILSGLHKLNLGFTNFIWGKFILHDTLGVSTDIAYHPVTKALGLLLPVSEVAAGLALLTPWKKWAFYFLIGMHLILLFILGPLGANWNSIVWPWNFQMIIFAVLYLKYFRFSMTWKKPSEIQLYLIIVILVGLPAISIFHKYFSPFTFNLYGGLNDYLYVSVSDREASELTTSEELIIHNSKTYRDVFNWSVEELNVPYIDNPFYFEAFITEYQKQYPDEQPEFILRTYPYRKENIRVIHQSQK